MAILTYAVHADLAQFVTPDMFADLDASNTGIAIRHASYLVREATHNDRYDVGTDDKPTDEKIAEAFKFAVCEQVAFWVITGQDLTTVAAGVALADPTVTSTSINGATVAASTASSDSEIQESFSGLIPVAAYYLKHAGLMSKVVNRVYG
jgi:hypothetical protein